MNINRENFERLAAHLENLVPPPEFSMRLFTNLLDGEDREYMATGQIPACGTVACAAGHGPVAGILDPDAEDWNEYVERNFLGEPVDGKFDNNRIYRWCFSCSWTDIDNTPTGAAKRIRYMLAHGIPEHFRFCDSSWIEVYANA